MAITVTEPSSEGGSEGETNNIAFNPKTPFGSDILDFICAMRSLGFNNDQIGQALLSGIEKGLSI